MSENPVVVGTQQHQYHLVEPSIWPLVGATASLVLVAGTLMWFVDKGPWVLVVGLLMVLATMFFWWRDVVNEAEHQGHHSPIVQIGLRYGMALFIVSEVMFFAAFFWAFFGNALYPMEAINHVWPPANVKTFDPFDLPFMNTLILLLSGVTVTWAHHALLEGDRKGLIQGLGVTILLGALFTSVQAYEYAHAAFSFKEGIYPSVFFMATGFHGFHVLIGTLFLTVCFFRALAGHFKPEQHFGFEAAAWYWHFVDVVWLFLFASIYVWGSVGAVIEGH
jgi:cytochrome c oxidase subunit III